MTMRRKKPAKLRRARTLVAYWHEAELVLENYRTRRFVAVEPVLIRALAHFEDWQFVERALDAMPEVNRRDLARAIRLLERETILVRKDSREARQDTQLARGWAGWLPHAGVLHFGTKDVPFTVTGKKLERTLNEFLSQGQQPPPSKSYPGSSQVRLRKPVSPFAANRYAGQQKAGPQDLFRILMERRTRREFSPDKLTMDQLSSLLYFPWGVTGTMRVPQLGSLVVKTSPSGGSRHPGEVYLLALRVDGLPPGLYHYSAMHHRLDRIRAGPVQTRAIRYCGGQKWAGKAAALFLMTAVSARTRWKYRIPRAYRALLVEAGHLCQVFLLVATALGLAPFCTMALADSLIERDLGIDGIQESALYVAGVGVPPRNDLRESRRRKANEALSPPVYPF